MEVRLTPRGADGEALEPAAGFERTAEFATKTVTSGVVGR